MDFCFCSFRSVHKPKLNAPFSSNCITVFRVLLFFFAVVVVVVLDIIIVIAAVTLCAGNDVGVRQHLS